jgi:folylpolyglutamate synthase/dihydropteroate synthase
MERLLAIAREKEAPVCVVGRDWVYERGEVGSGEWGVGSEKRSGQWLRIVKAPELAFVPQPATFWLALAGAHQLENATVALAALDVVQPTFPRLTPEAVEAGLANVHWTGRLQIVHQGEGTPTLLVDCAHNPDSAAKLRHALTHDYTYERLWLILGATADKDVAGIMSELLPLAEATIATISSHPRAADPAELARLAAELGYEIVTSPTIAEALMSAWRVAGAKDLICVTGSIFIVGDLLNQWESLQSRLFHDYVGT